MIFAVFSAVLAVCCLRFLGSSECSMLDILYLLACCIDLLSSVAGLEISSCQIACRRTFND